MWLNCNADGCALYPHLEQPLSNLIWAIRSRRSRASVAVLQALEQYLVCLPVSSLPHLPQDTFESDCII